MSKILIEELLKLTKIKTKGELEIEIGLSKNSLASILSGKKQFSGKAIGKVEAYLNRGVKPEPQPKEKPKTATAMAELLKYCDINGVNFDDLPNHIEKLTLQLAASQKALNDLQAKVVKINWIKPDAMAYDGEKIKNQKDEYDPYKNPAFRAKMGIKTEKKEDC